MGFLRQEYWSGLPFPPPKDHPGIKPESPALAFFTSEAHMNNYWFVFQYIISGAVLVIEGTLENKTEAAQSSWNILVRQQQFKNIYPHAAAAKSLQLCPTLCDPIDGSAPGFPVPGILQARTLEWVAIAFSHIHTYTPTNSI